MKRKKLHPITTEKLKRHRSKAAGMREVTRLSQGFVLYGEAKSKTSRLKSSETAAVLVKKAGRALARPGISKDVIFPPGQPGLFAYSIYPKDPSKIVRESSTGKRTLGRFVGGRFKAL